MSNSARRQDSLESGSSVIPFPSHYSRNVNTEPGSASLTRHDVGFSDLQEDLKAVVDAWVAELYIRQVIGNPQRPDNPFDSVYVSTLAPDPVAHGDIQRLWSYRDLEDLSDTIVFDDGLDD